MSKGKVFLVGSGPGDPELITIKGLQVLKSCDIILYDSLVDEKIWDYHNLTNSKKIFVGKRKGKHSFTQEEINQMLLELSLQGNKIARLKGGDPFIFGRGGEEIYYLMKHSIEVEVIPGITSATAAAAYLKIPLTHRELGRSLILLSGYSSFNAEDETGFPEYNWKLLADPFITLIFYMGLFHLEKIANRLIEEGRRKETPAVIISKISYPDQKVIKGNLQNIYSLSMEQKAEFPALFIVGEVIQIPERFGIL